MAQGTMLKANILVKVGGGGYSVECQVEVRGDTLDEVLKQVQQVVTWAKERAAEGSGWSHSSASDQGGR